jgi:plastocyanin
MTAQTSSALAAVVLGAFALVVSALSISSVPQPAQVPPEAAPTTVELSVIITGIGAVGESRHHFFNPSMIVVRRGDTVRLRVMNLTFATHGFEIQGYGIGTGRLPGGPKGQETLTFVANKAGVFKFHCNVPYNPTTGDCSPDHETQVGYLVVLDPSR